MTTTTFSSGVTIASSWLNDVNGATYNGTAAYTPSGGVPTTMAAKLQQTVSVMDFGATGNGVTDDTAAIQAAITTINAAGGGIVYVPTGTYKCSSTINMYPKIILRGAGSSSNGLTGSVLKFSHAGSTGYTGDGLLMLSPINTSTSVNTSVENLTLWNTNGANIGAGYDDVGGAFVNLYNVAVFGFKYGVIFDQTELATIRMCNLSQQITSGIWLVNGPSHTAGASSLFTNRINISECQINESSTCYGIVDDGGYAHTFQDNNYNGCSTWIRLSGGSSINVIGGEFESNSSAGVYMSNLRLDGGSVGSCTNTSFIGTMMISASAGLNCIQNVSTGTMTLVNNWFSNSTITIAMSGGCVLKAIGNVGATYSGAPQLGSFQDDLAGTFTPAITFDTPGDLAVAYSTQTGKYQRIGNVVNFSLTIFCSSFTKTTSSGYLRITGLPYSASGISGLDQPANCAYQGITKAGYTSFVPYFTYGNSYMNIAACGTGISLTSVVAGDMPSGGTPVFFISGSYQV